MNQQNDILLLEELLSSVKNKGYKKTFNLLKKFNEVELEVSDPYDSFVIALICNTFKISVEQLIYDRYVRGERKYAVGFVVYYLYQERTLGYISKNIFKNKNKALIGRYRQLIFDLNKKDLPYFELKDQLDKEVESFKTKNKIK